LTAKTNSTAKKINRSREEEKMPLAKAAALNYAQSMRRRT